MDILHKDPIIPSFAQGTPACMTCLKWETCDYSIHVRNLILSGEEIEVEQLASLSFGGLWSKKSSETTSLPPNHLKMIETYMLVYYPRRNESE